MEASSFTFIPNHAVNIQPCIPPIAINALGKRWNHYDVEKNTEMMSYIWERVYSFIPKTCNGQSLIGYNLNKTVLKTGKNETKKEEDKYYKGGISLITIFIFLENKEGYIKFYDDKEKGVSFCKKADYFKVEISSGNAVFFTNLVRYEIPVSSCILKIPVFYKSNNTPKIQKRVHFKKTFEIPTPNGEKFNKVQYVNNGEVFTLTPSIFEEQNIKRWKEVESKQKVLQINKYKVPKYINNKKGRPPTNKEDYCPNCYEILSLRLPINYNNCSGCLSQIIGINEHLIKT